MSASAASARIHDVDKRLRLLWADLRVDWRDENARQFETELIEPLLVRMRAAEDALQQLDAVLHEVRRDCE